MMQKRGCIYAKNVYEAMKIAQKLPAVKHNRIPLKLVKITKEEYEEGRQKHSYYETMDNIFKN